MTINYDIQSIKLTDDYLTDPILLALSWKRAHNYVRSINWYADNFELDKSSLFLQEQCSEWSRELGNKKIRLESLKLVLAPKSSQWVFESKDTDCGLKEEWCLVWKPKEGEKLSLRPLAHIGIKEQTYFTLLMTCLANIVETKQGDPATDFKEVHKKGVVSYGNRLYCTYIDGEARHNYGSSSVYSKYFADYRSFLKRPMYFANSQSFEKLDNEDVYVVELDLKCFFDSVNREKLVEKIKILRKEQLAEEFQGNPKTEKVDSLLTKFVDWKWSQDAGEEYEVCLSQEEDKNKEISAPKGIPQGLVAGGFLSNIYLLEIDELMMTLLPDGLNRDNNLEGRAQKDVTKIAKLLKKYKIKVNDYCRYVDDVRIVITAPRLSKGFFLDDFEKSLSKFVTIFLDRRKLNLKINKDKTKVTPYRSSTQGLSSQMDDIQQRVSGPMGSEHIDNLINELEGILSLSSTELPTQDGQHCRINKLAEIERSIFDVREDTLLRFTTNKLAQALKEKRHFTSRDVAPDGNHLPGEWDFTQERVARKLIAAWSRDPALVLLLKKGLELFPSPRLLEPVIEQLKEIKKCDRKQKAIADYCLAEVFRHSATVIHKKDVHAIPAHANVSEFFEILQKYAADLVDKSDDKHSGWSILIEQARFLLLIRLDNVLEKKSGNNQYDLIFKLVKGFRNIEISPEEEDSIALCILLAAQLLDDSQPLVRSSVELLSKKFKEDGIVQVENILKKIAIQSIDLVEMIIQQARVVKADWLTFEEVKKTIKKLYLDIAPSRKPLEEITIKRSILQLILRKDNPFANEIMAIKLMQGLVAEVKKNISAARGKQIDLAATTVQSAHGFSQTPRYIDFEKDLLVEVEFQEPIIADLLEKNLSLTDEQLALRKVAFVIRAALAGNKDSTGLGVSHKARVGYRGLKSTRTKREIGLYTTPESLGGEGAQTSGWLTTLLTKLLRWPGIRVNEQGYSWPANYGIEEVESLLTARLEELKSVYCRFSFMPALPELIIPNWEESKATLNVVMVQSKMPKQRDFQFDWFLNAPQYRSLHRRHVADVAELTVQYIKVGGFKADLIIWPELAVHEDDLDVLKQLSQKTHAIIFAGLVFFKKNNGSVINTAVWIVPRKHNGNSNEIMRLQGKYHLTSAEAIHVQPWRPYQLMLELRHPKYPHKKGFMLTGAICYDATDIKLSADLTNKSNAFIISALNQDVNTFDTMIEALHYHMYQHVVLVNGGEFGGSYAMAPYKERYDKLIAHNSGKDQVAISSFQMNMFDFRRDGVGEEMTSGLVKRANLKTPPAGIF